MTEHVDLGVLVPTGRTPAAGDLLRFAAEAEELG
jgi:hypothetical protein